LSKKGGSDSKKSDADKKKKAERAEFASPRANIADAWDDAEDEDSDGGDGDLETLYVEKEVVFVAEHYERAKKCIEDGNHANFEEAIQNMQVNMQSPTDMSNTLLHWAVGFNKLEMVRMLLMKGARNLANEVGVTPVEIAIGAVDSGDYSFFEVRNLLAITLS